jgi:histidinol-phosphate phosphatase family protein
VVALINQAVILCGGLGSRLRPFTDNLPKPMVLVKPKPFLHHLLEQIAGQGVKEFVLLTGYLGSLISDYFGDGSKYGWHIRYHHGPVEWDTGRRLWEARALCQPNFILLYSDNFVQFQLSQLAAAHEDLGLAITLTLAPKVAGNIKVNDQGHIEGYDKRRQGVGFEYVEVGYMLIRRDFVFRDFATIPCFPDFNFSELLQRYAGKKMLGGIVKRAPYHSISDPERYQLMCEHLQHKKILLIDRDGTMNKKASPGEYIGSWSQFEWISKNREAMKSLAMAGFKFIVITNQAGIARNMIEPDALANIHQNMMDELLLDGIEILRVYVSPHHWNENSFMRKPAPGMFFQAASDFNLRMDRVIYIGDDDRDCEAAINAGCGMLQLTSQDAFVATKLQNNPVFFSRASTLCEEVDRIINQYKLWEQTDATAN